MMQTVKLVIIENRSFHVTFAHEKSSDLVYSEYSGYFELLDSHTKDLYKTKPFKFHDFCVEIGLTLDDSSVIELINLCLENIVTVTETETETKDFELSSSINSSSQPHSSVKFNTKSSSYEIYLSYKLSLGTKFQLKSCYYIFEYFEQKEIDRIKLLYSDILKIYEEINGDNIKLLGSVAQLQVENEVLARDLISLRRDFLNRMQQNKEIIDYLSAELTKIKNSIASVSIVSESNGTLVVRHCAENTQ